MADYAKVIKDGMGKKKNSGTGKNYKGAVEGKPDSGFMRDMGYGATKKKKKVK